jgi:hypothetical protein
MCSPAGGIWHLYWTPYGIGQITLDFKSVLHCIHSLWFLQWEDNIQFTFNIEYIYTEKGTDIKCYQSRMSTWKVPLQHFLIWKWLLMSLVQPIKTRPTTFNWVCSIPWPKQEKQWSMPSEMKKKFEYSMNSIILLWQYYTYMQ